MRFRDGSGISWTISKHSAPRSRQITTPSPHHSMFTGQCFRGLRNSLGCFSHVKNIDLHYIYITDALPNAQPTASKHWRLIAVEKMEILSRPVFLSGLSKNTCLILKSRSQYMSQRLLSVAVSVLVLVPHLLQNVTSAWWQVTLCDVSSLSSVAT